MIRLASLRPVSLRPVSPAPQRRDRALELVPGLVTVAACAIVAAVSLATTTTGDYMTHGAVGGDNPAPAIAALLHGHLAAFAAHQPLMGLTSVLLRAPFAGLASLLGGGNLLAYRLGALACMLSLALFVAWLAGRRRTDAVGRFPGLLAAAVLLLSPAAIDAVHAGHPEEVLAGVLATAAVLAATRGRGGWAGVMLGVAVGTKQWALIAVVPVFIALPGRFVRTAVLAGAVAAVLTIPAVIADPAAFARANNAVGATHLVNPLSIWWPASAPLRLAGGGLAPARWLPLGLTRSTASLLVLALALLGSGLGWARARRRGSACDALALLTLLGIVRCAGDPMPIEYYYLAALIPLAAWEVVGLGRLPLLTMLASGAVAIIPGDALHLRPAALSATSIVGTLIFVGYLIHRTFHPLVTARVELAALHPGKTAVLSR